MSDQPEDQEPPRQFVGIIMRELQNHTIRFRPEDWLFEVSGPEFDYLSAREKVFLSYEDARKKIESILAESAEVKAKALKIGLNVLEEDGLSVICSGIDRRNSSLAGIKLNSQYVYPDLPWIREALKRLQELKAIQLQLEKIKIKVSRGYNYGRSERMTGQACIRETSLLQKEFEEKLTLARQLAGLQPIPAQSVKEI